MERSRLAGLHDRLWNAQERWFAMRAEGATKHGLKLQGLRECGDPNRFCGLPERLEHRRPHADEFRLRPGSLLERLGPQLLDQLFRPLRLVL